MARHSGPERRLCTGVLRCGKCGGRLESHTRTDQEWEPVTIHRREAHPVRQSRYVCRSCQGIAILAEPTERIIAAAVEHRRGAPLPTRHDQARQQIAQAIKRVDVVPALPGQAVYCPERLRVTWQDGSLSTGGPLDLHNPVPRPAAALTDPAAYERWRLAAWRAVYDRAGAALAAS